MLRLEPVRRALIGHACRVLVAAVIGGVCVVTVFDWELASTLAGAALGTAIWGALYFFEVRDRVPRGTLLEPPPGAVLDEPKASPRHLMLVPLIVGLAWLADRWELGAVFVPGHTLGMAAAYFAGAVLVARWERAHGRRVLMAADDLYAVP